MRRGFGGLVCFLTAHPTASNCPGKNGGTVASTHHPLLISSSKPLCKNCIQVNAEKCGEQIVTMRGMRRVLSEKPKRHR